ncbi:hypothetical protein LMG7974_00973 [Campylobacter majalis]|uniref:Fe/B12 periplasmic-binding domain-containing protein n=1 Tax=Campylobacter majalis TaxID=2790656 RepID=A0ABM8Q6E0_9BACT|nr:ABC transporter substrate-binding protein [Campylobacter majalis]CAD7288365.1 hypothetical protein LMG7974_00973 [Campylobacter majalis]
MRVLLAFFMFILFCFGNEIIVKDMRGVDVKIKQNLSNIATIDDGFVESVMTHLGVIDKVKVIGSWSMKRDYKYEYEKISGEKYTLRGWNVMKYLHPWLDELPCINSAQGNIINYETLAKANPELVILRVGDCTLRGSNKEATQKTIQTIQALQIPLIVLHAPRGADISSMKEELRVLGEIFNQKQKALDLFEYLNQTQTLIKQRTQNIKDKANVLYLGLNASARKSGGVASSWGVNTPESFILQNIVNANNAFRGEGSGVVLNLEQIYATNPDVIMLPTFHGYHPVDELLHSVDFMGLSELNAVKNRRVYAMPWTPMNCAKRLEYPLDMLIIAKAAYPEIFNDIKVHEYALNFYKHVYNVDDETAKALLNEQILGWTIELDF